jgi:hypothetical protein
MNVLLLRWDTKPTKRIRGTFPRPTSTRRTSFYAAGSASETTGVAALRATGSHAFRRIGSWSRLDEVAAGGSALTGSDPWDEGLSADRAPDGREETNHCWDDVPLYRW